MPRVPLVPQVPLAPAWPPLLVIDDMFGALPAQAMSALLSRIGAWPGAVVLTSRVSIDMVQKCAAIGVPVLIAVSAPTAGSPESILMPVQLASQSGGAGSGRVSGASAESRRCQVGSGSGVGTSSYFRTSGGPYS